MCKNIIKSHTYKRNKYIRVTVVLLAIVNLTNEFQELALAFALMDLLHHMLLFRLAMVTQSSFSVY